MKRAHLLATRRIALALAAAAFLLSACQLHGGSRVDQLNDLRGPTQDLRIELREGTNMAASPSPDGKRIVFSAQGALWVIPVAGGSAVRITGWRLEPTAPVWSPDGKRIAFQNYAPEGNYHIWTIAPDGSQPVELTTGPNDDREPAWAPDGSALVFSSDRGNDGQYKIWSVAAGGGAPTQITIGPGAESNPVVSPDGTQLAYVDGAHVLTRALAGGTPVVIASGTAPAWTPDGASLVYQDGERQLVLHGLQVTRGEDIFPFPVRFLPDGRFLYTADGHIRVRDAAGGATGDIGFRAELMLRRPVLSRPKEHGFDDFGMRQVRGISAPVLSPDGRNIAFVALNDVWVMPIGAEPRRLTDDSDRDASPQWTADGRAVYFSSDRGNAGQLAVDQVDIATGARTRLAAIPGRSMATPKLSPTGDRIAYQTPEGQLEIWHRASGAFQVIAKADGSQASTPQWLPDGRRIMVVDNERINNRFREGYNKLRVIDLATGRGSFHAVAPAPRQISERDEGAAVLSPDGARVAFIMDSLLQVMAVNADGSPAGPPKVVSTEPADLPSWGDSNTLLYKSASRLRIVRFAGIGWDKPREVGVNLRWQQAAPIGSTLIRAGALWDGTSAILRYDVDILVRRNRIAWIRPHQSGSELQAERFIDASALTVMPGLIETRIHPLTLYRGGQVGRWLPLMLSYGVTTGQSVGGPLHQGIELRESLESGSLAGPRLLVSPPLWEGNRLFYHFARSLRTPAVADAEIAKAKAMDVDFMNADARAPIPIMHRIAQGALDLGVPSGTHLIEPGGATGIADTTHFSAAERMGYSWSKSAVRAIAYQDAYDTYANGAFQLIDTLFSGAPPAGQDPGIADDPRFILVPPGFVAKAGAPGIQLHLDLRAAGPVLGNYTALQTVTINAARMALVDRDLGSVEPGKLADLIAVRGNPLLDLRAAAAVEVVMKNGRAFTQAEILAPFSTPAAVAARRDALAAYQARCRSHPAECVDDGRQAE